MFKTKKREYFRNFAETINFKTNRTYVWNKCKILNNSWVKITNTALIDPNQIKEKSISCIKKLCSPYDNTNPDLIPSGRENAILDSHFTFAESNKVLNSTKVKASPGLDGIDNEIIHKIPMRYKLLLLDIYNEMYQKNDYPNDWQHTFIHMINKADAKSVRPIALTSCLCKIFEKLVKN